MKNLIFILALILAPLTSFGQWTQIATYNQTPIIVNSGTWLRYGSTADNKWFYKAYTANKTITSWTAEFTTNPDPTANSTTFVLQVFQLPLASNVLAQTITVAGTKITVPAASNSTTPPQPVLSGTYQLSATCIVNVTTMSVTCK